jgi:hypothetical protein
MKRLCLGLFLSFITAMAILAGCGGGGGDDAQPIVAVSGDSLTSSHVMVAPGRLDVPSVRRLNEYAKGRFFAIDWSQPGATTVHAIEGSPTLPVEAFATLIKSAPIKTVVLRWGGADAVLHVPVEVFRKNLTDMVNMANEAGVRPVLVEVIDLGGGNSAPSTERNLIVHEVAAATGATLVPLRDLACGFIDPVHPGQECVDAHMARLAEYLP